VAGEFNLKYFYVSAASLLNKFVGVTEESIRNTFEAAKANRPAVLLIDEIDALGTKRQQVGDADDTGGAARSFNSMTARLMECVDDARKYPGLILIAATNFYDGLDRALIREVADSISTFDSIYRTRKRGRGSFRPTWRSGPRDTSTFSHSRKERRAGARPKLARSWIAPPSLLPNSIEVSKSAT
jgi:SpoVK/Ycf46/Vps4 family AAA+-type ATPase